MIAEMSKPTPKLANASPKNKTAVAGSKKTAKEEGAILNRGIQDPPLIESQFIRFPDSPISCINPFLQQVISPQRLISCVRVLMMAYRFRPFWG